MTVFGFFSLIFLTHIATFINGDYIFPCYYYYEPNGLTPDVIPTDLCTHIILFSCVNEENLIIEPQTKPFDCSYAFEKVAKLRDINPNLKLILSIGTNAPAMHKVVSNLTQMENYIDSAVSLVYKYKFQGIDIDWEFPCDDDKVLFTKFLQLLRHKVGDSLKLSAAIGASIDLLTRCYDLDGLVSYLDYIHVMCYNYNTIYNNYTAYSQPLYARPEEIGNDATLNANYTINYLIENKVPKEKIVLGMSADGHSFQLKDKNINGFHAPVFGVGYANGWTILSQICKTMKSGGTAVYDEIAEAFYVYYEDQWANCGDVRSAIVKSKWVIQNQLAGVFTWALNIDDNDNVCGYNENFPLHTAIKNTLFKRRV